MRTQMRQIVRLTLGFLVVFGGLGCGNDEPLDEVRLRGSATAVNEEAITDTIDAQIFLIVESEDDGSPCPAITQHRAMTDLEPNASGDYELTLTLAEFAPLSHTECLLVDRTNPRVQAMRITGMLPANTENCANFCANRTGSSRTSCLRTCARSESIVANSRSESPDLLSNQTFTIALNFNELSTPLPSPSPSPTATPSPSPTTTPTPSPSPSHTPSPTPTPTGRPDLTVGRTALLSSWIIKYKSFAANSCAAHEGCLTGTGVRKLLAFDGVVVNSSPYPLVIGDPAHYDDASYDSCHAHYHVAEIMTYELLAPGGEVVATGRKQGFCLMDSTRVSGSRPSRYTCRYQGISPGWADVYDRTLDCQWIDITGVVPGSYRLRLTTNPTRALRESNYSNNSAEINVEIP